MCVLCGGCVCVCVCVCLCVLCACTFQYASCNVLLIEEMMLSVLPVECVYHSRVPLQVSMATHAQRYY